MKTLNNLKGGFAPLLVIALVAILAVGGGTYVAKKNKEKKMALEGNVETQANANADANANANANLGIDAKGASVGKAKNSLRALLAQGTNQQCTFTSTADGSTSSGTTYIAADGDMRGDFTTKTSATASTNSSIIVKDGVSYVWSGTQGAKMNVANIDSKVEAQADKYVDMDAQVEYDCKAWVLDSSKFTLPTGVNFVDVDAMLKAGGSIKMPAVN